MKAALGLVKGTTLGAGSLLPEIGNYGPGKSYPNVVTSLQRRGCLKQ